MLSKLKTKLREKRKGMSLGELPSVGLAFLLIAVIFGVGGLVLAEMNDQVSDSNATAILNEGTDAIKDLSGWLPIIGVVVAAVVIIALIVRGFSGSTGRSSL